MNAPRPIPVAEMLNRIGRALDASRDEQVARLVDAELDRRLQALGLPLNSDGRS